MKGLQKREMSASWSCIIATYIPMCVLHVLCACLSSLELSSEEVQTYRSIGALGLPCTRCENPSPSIFYFHTYLGKIPNLTTIFQMG